MAQPIHNSFAPLATRSQIALALGLQCTPWVYTHGRAVQQLRNALEHHFAKQCALFSSGRQALLASLQAINIQPGDEVILQGYTCTVLSNAIMAIGAIPVYCDIDPNTVNINPVEAERKCTDRTKAIICQHTFGIPGPLTALQKLCTERNIVLIEDCAHTIATYPSATVGHTGDIVLLSFGRDKAISGVTGGAAISSVPEYAARLQRYEEQSTPLAWHTIAKLLAYPLRYQAAKTLWRVGLGRVYLKILQICGGLPAIYTPKERKGIMSKRLNSLPNGCAILALQQWQQLPRFNTQRAKLTAFYQEQLQTHAITTVSSAAVTSASLQKYPILVQNRDYILQELQHYGIHLQDGWCGAVINPPSIESSDVMYCQGTTPEAERIASTVLNLPTHPTMSLRQAKKVIITLKKVLSEQPYN
jgi:perosamine synthetase